MAKKVQTSDARAASNSSIAAKGAAVQNQPKKAAGGIKRAACWCCAGVLTLAVAALAFLVLYPFLLPNDDRIAFYRDLAASQPTSADAHHKLGLALYSAAGHKSNDVGTVINSLNQAIEALSTCVELSPSNDACGTSRVAHGLRRRVSRTDRGSQIIISSRRRRCDGAVCVACHLWAQIICALKDTRLPRCGSFTDSQCPIQAL
jgi:hypothetical protein